MNKYNRLVTKLYSVCEISDEYPNAPVLVDADKMSDILEELFNEEGLISFEEG